MITLLEQYLVTYFISVLLFLLSTSSLESSSTTTNVIPPVSEMLNTYPSIQHHYIQITPRHYAVETQTKTVI